MITFKSFITETGGCWSGYKRVSGKKKFEKGSCVREETKSGDSSLHDWFTKSKSSDGKPGWVQLGGRYAGKSCAKQPGQTTKPKCGSSKMAANMSDKEEDAAAKRKRAQDPNPNRNGKAINVATEGKRKMKEEIEHIEEDACTTKVKSRYSVWPSAYASGALVKCRKVGAANWGNKTKKEDVQIMSFKRFIEETQADGAGGDSPMFTKSPMMKKQYDMTYKKKPVPPEKADNDQMDESEAWTRKAGKNPEGGLNRKGIESYRAAHPGSHLSMAVTTKPSKLDPDSKAAKRRKSFCARMSGVEGPMKKPNGEPTRKALALKKWNC